MSRRRLELLLWFTASLMGTAAGVRLVGERPELDPAYARAAHAPPDPRPPASDSALRAAAWIASVNPFRLSRRPADVAYRPELEGAPPPPPSPPKPTLLLAGVIGGPPWQAVIEGVAGREGGVVVREGDVVEGFRVRHVGPDEVVITGMDTTWNLAVRRPW